MEGNFGQLFDQLNVSVDLLSREFSTELILQVSAFPVTPPAGQTLHLRSAHMQLTEALCPDLLQEQQQQSVLGGALLDQEFTQAVRGSFQKLRTTVEQLLNVLQLLLSLTFITIFTQYDPQL